MQPDGFEIDQRGQTIVATIGQTQVTHLQMQELIDECEQRLRCDNARRFILDMTGVQFLASRF